MRTRWAVLASSESPSTQVRIARFLVLMLAHFGTGAMCCGMQAQGQQQRPVPEESKKSEAPSRALYWLGPSGAQLLNSVNSWSLMSKAQREAWEKDHAATGKGGQPADGPDRSGQSDEGSSGSQASSGVRTGQEDRPGKPLTPPGESDTLVFEDDAKAFLGGSMKVARLSLMGHSLSVTGHNPATVLEVKAGIALPDGGLGESLRLENLTIETNGVDIGGAVALLPSAERNEVALIGGTWIADRSFSIAAGSFELSGAIRVEDPEEIADGTRFSLSGGVLRMLSGSIACDVFASTSGGELWMSGGSINATKAVFLTPDATGGISVSGGRVQTSELHVTPNGSSIALSGSTQLQANVAHLALPPGTNRDIVLSGGSTLRADLIRVDGEGRGRVNVSGGGNLVADVGLQVSAGSADSLGLLVREGGRVEATKLDVLQGSVGIGRDGLVAVRGSPCRVVDGVLNLQGGRIECATLQLQAPRDLEGHVDGWPDRTQFRAVETDTSQALSAADEAQIAQAMLGRFLEVVGRAVESGARPESELILMQQYAQRLKGSAKHPAAMKALAEEFQRQLAAIQGGSAASEETDDQSGGISLPPADLARLLGVLQRTDSDASSARSLAELGAAFTRGERLINQESDSGGVDHPGSADPIVERILKVQLGERRHASVLGGFGVVGGSVVNDGIVQPRAGGADSSESLVIAGNYSQPPSGVLDVAIDGANPWRTVHLVDPVFPLHVFSNIGQQLAANYLDPEHAVPLVVTDTIGFGQPASYLQEGNQPEEVLAALRSAVEGGAVTAASGVRVRLSNPQSLAPGQRFDVAYSVAGDIVGRPPRFADSRIPERESLFFGIYCGNYPSSIGVSWPLKVVSLLVLKVPMAVRVGIDNSISLNPITSSDVLKPNLVLITHGTRSSTDAADADQPYAVMRVAAQMARFAHETGLDDEWTVAVIDWREFATGPADTTTDIFFQPVRSAGFGDAIGRSLVDWLLDGRSDAGNLRQIHVIGHSSGSWLTDGFARRLHQRSLEFGPSGPPRLQTTDFDAFTWAAAWVSGEYTSTADVAERYLDGRLPGTMLGHPFGSTIDVAWLDPDLTIDSGQRKYRNSDGRPIPSGFLSAKNGETDTRTAPEVLKDAGLEHPWELFSYAKWNPAANGHAWPTEWYARSIEAARGLPCASGSVWCPDLCAARWGFATSPMYAEFLRRQGRPVENRLSALRGKTAEIPYRLPGAGDCGSASRTPSP